MRGWLQTVILTCLLSIQSIATVVEDSLFNIDSIISNTTKRHHCGGLKHSSMTRPCFNDDKYCGRWKDRHWYSLGCHYQDISSENARKCLGNRTIAFIGDSQVRDIGVGVAMFLLGQTIDSAADQKLGSKISLDGNDTKKLKLISTGTRIPDFKSWQHNVAAHTYHHDSNGFIFPRVDDQTLDQHKWQIQIWNLDSNEFIDLNQSMDVLSNRMTQEFEHLHPIDLAFWSYGVIDYGWWDKQPYGENYYNHIVKKWLDIRDLVPVPTVWVSMNSNCLQHLKFTDCGDKGLQVKMVDEANRYVNNRTLHEKLPYWDAASVLRGPDRCNLSDDGLHVKMFVDVMRAKMLFNHLCDHEMNWRGSVDYFI